MSSGTIIEIARKGFRAIAALISVAIILVASVAFGFYAIASGYFLTGTYGALVFPTLIALLCGIWSIRKVFLYAFSRLPLIFATENQLSYVAPGHAVIPMVDVDSYAITESAFRRLHFFTRTGQGLGCYPLFLSSSSSAEVVDRLTALGLKHSDRAPLSD